MDKSLVIKPLITEKATMLGSQNKYMFLVKDEATSSEIKKIIAAEYKVKIDRVQCINTRPKKRRLGRTFGTIPGYRKAIVTLKKGEKLEILPQ